MALIQIKKSSTAGATPTLADGELAINQADMKLFAKDSTGTVKFINFTSDTEKVASGPISTALSLKLDKTGGIINGTFNIKPDFMVINSRGLYGTDTEWLGNSANGAPNVYGYGSFAAGVFLSPIGDVGISAATRTDMITTGGRFPAAVNGQTFNFKTTDPLTSWGGYFEARRKVGAGQIHGIEVNVTDLGDGSDRIIPSAIGSGANAVYSAYAMGVAIACGGNITTRTLPDGTVVQQQTGWDGQKAVMQASNCGVALAIYNNGAKFEKGIIISEKSLVGADGTGGPNEATAIEMGRGHRISWIDGSTRLGSYISSDVSPSGNSLRIKFTDTGVTFDGYGGNTLTVGSKVADINGIQILGGTTGNSARIIGVGSTTAGISLETQSSGYIYVPGLKNATNDSTAATLGVPINGLYRNASVLMIRVA